MNDKNKIIRHGSNIHLAQKKFFFLCRNAYAVFNKGELFELILKSFEKEIILKWGIDITGYGLHLGHLVSLKKIKEFLNHLNCSVFIILGDFTALAHDPTRSFSTLENIKYEMDIKRENMKKQIADFFQHNPKVHIVSNSEWLKNISLIEILEYARLITVKELLSKFKVDNLPVSSTIYPILQGIDSLYLKCDIEFGGSDQLFNILTARELTEKFSPKKQIAFIMPLMKNKMNEKMSKSLGNVIFLGNNPILLKEKLYALNDETFIEYCNLLGYEIGNINNVLDLQKFKTLTINKIITEIFSIPFLEKKQFIVTFQKSINIIDLCLNCFDTIGKKISRVQIKRLIFFHVITFNSMVISNNIEIRESGILQIGKKYNFQVIKNEQNNAN